MCVGEMKWWYLKDDYDVSSWRFGTSKSITKSTSSDKTYASSAIASLMMWFLIWDADSWRLILKPNAPNCGKTQQITEKIWNPATTCTMLVLWIQEAQNRKMRLPPEGPYFGRQLQKNEAYFGAKQKQTTSLHFCSHQQHHKASFALGKRREVVSTLASFFIQEPACLD